jgi:hypothetical protein
MRLKRGGYWAAALTLKRMAWFCRGASPRMLRRGISCPSNGRRAYELCASPMPAKPRRRGLFFALARMNRVN